VRMLFNAEDAEGADGRGEGAWSGRAERRDAHRIRPAEAVAYAAMSEPPPSSPPQERWDRLARRLTRVLVFVVLGLPLVYYGPEDFRFLEGAAVVEGTVRSVERREQGPLTITYARVGFRLGDKVYRYPAALPPFETVKEGERLEVLFNPDVYPYLKPNTLRSRYRVVDIWLLFAVLTVGYLALRVALRRALHHKD
jgi:hypothetical protein